MSTVWVPSEASRVAEQHVVDAGSAAAAAGAMPDVVGRPGRLPALVGQLARVAEPGVVELAHHVVVRAGVHVADDQVGVVRPRPASGSARWSARHAGRVRTGRDRVHGEHGQRADVTRQHWKGCASRAARRAARWRRSSSPPSRSGSPTRCGSSSASPRRPAARGARGVISWSTSTSTSSRRTASTTFLGVGRRRRRCSRSSPSSAAPRRPAPGCRRSPAARTTRRAAPGRQSCDASAARRPDLSRRRCTHDRRPGTSTSSAVERHARAGERLHPDHHARCRSVPAGRNVSARAGRASPRAARTRPQAPNASHQRSTRSSRCTTSRSYAAPSSRLRSCEERPSSAGQLGGVEVDQPAGHRRRRPAPAMSTGSPACEGAGDAGDAGGEQRGAPLGDRRDRAVVEQQRAARLGGVRQPEQPGRPAPAGGVEQGADRLAGKRLRGPLGGREHDRDAGAGGDPGGLDLGLHAAGAEPGRAGPARSGPRLRSADVRAPRAPAALPGAAGSAS